MYAAMRERREDAGDLYLFIYSFIFYHIAYGAVSTSNRDPWVNQYRPHLERYVPI